MMRNNLTVKKTIRKMTALALAVLMVLAAGCGVSSYAAVGLVRTNTTRSASLNFYSLKGRISFTLKSSAEGDVSYTARLESGTATVYLQQGSLKEVLFTIRGGEQAEARGGYVEAGRVTIIVETDGTCKNGAFQFGVE